MAFEVIQKPVGTLDLLLYLRRRGPQNVSTILSEVKIPRDTFYEAVARLRALGFVYDEERRDFPVRKFYGLTRVGEAFAATLAPAAEVLSTTAVSLEAELTRLDDAGDPASVPRRLEILEVVADREFALGRWTEAEAGAKRLVELAAGAKDARREARGRLGLGRILQKRDRHEDAVRALDEAQRLAEGAGEWGAAAEAAYLIGSDFERQGRYPEALERFATAEGHASRAQEPLWTARGRLGRARVLSRQGRPSDALLVMMEAIAEFQRLRAEDDLPKAYASMGAAAYLANRNDALDWFDRAIDAARRAADVRTEAYTMSSAAAKLIDLQQWGKAESYLTRAREIFAGLEEQTGLGGATLNLANLYSALGRWSEADASFQETLRIAQTAGNRWQEASVFLNRGQTLKRRGLREEARASVTAARRIFEEVGAAAKVTRCDEELRDLTV